MTKIKNTTQKVGKDYGKSYKPWSKKKLNIMSVDDRKKGGK